MWSRAQARGTAAAARRLPPGRRSYAGLEFGLLAELDAEGVEVVLDEGGVEVGLEFGDGQGAAAGRADEAALSRTCTEVYER
ncbi:hypothetical protein [Actinocorallia herbida]|uniref:hypothetical protein n=1 Tax=Actinocorallia herbida TaxID=58109 RepID=UPI000F4B63A6|nr:hypothetical protein [Actinocorallia herbida]